MLISRVIRNQDGNTKAVENIRLLKMNKKLLYEQNSHNWDKMPKPMNVRWKYVNIDAHDSDEVFGTVDWNNLWIKLIKCKKWVIARLSALLFQHGWKGSANNKQLWSYMGASQPFEGRHVTFVHAGVSVLENCQFVDFTKLFKQGFQVFFFQVPRYLPDKQLNGILVFNVAALRMNWNGFWPVHGFRKCDLRVLALMWDK